MKTNYEKMGNAIYGRKQEECNIINDPIVWSECVGKRILIGVGDQYFREKEAYLGRLKKNSN